MNLKRLVGVGTVCGVLVLAGTAMGQGKAEPPLKGPPVGKERPAHLEDRFSEGKDGRRDAMGDQGIPMQAFVRIVGQLRGEDAPEGLRLSDEQEEKVAAIEQEFRRATREAQQKAQQEAAERPAKRRGQADEAAMSPEEMRERRQELMKNAPKPKDFQVRVWAVLSEPQQKFVGAEVKRVQAEMEKRRGEEYMKRQIERMEKEKPRPDSPEARPDKPARKPEGKPEGRPGAGPKPGQPGAAGRPVEGRPLANMSPEGRERARRIMERMQQLPPEQRQRLLARLEQELDRIEREGGRPRAEEPKPPPPMDEVNVPPPERPRR